MLVIFSNHCLWGRGLCSNLRGNDTEKPHRTTLKVRCFTGSWKKNAETVSVRTALNDNPDGRYSATGVTHSALRIACHMKSFRFRFAFVFFSYFRCISFILYYFVVSNYLGFRLMDALQMVNFARKWKNVPKQMHCEVQKYLGIYDKYVSFT